MKQAILILIFLSTFCLTLSAQVSENLCPQIKLILPDEILYPEQPATFSVKVESGKQLGKLDYFWIFSGGEITKGQGEFRVEFMPNEEDNNLRLAVAVKVVGLPENCSDTVSDFILVAGSPISKPVGELSEGARADEIKNLVDNFFVAITNSFPKSQGLVEVIFNKSDSRNYKISLLRKIFRQLNFRKYDKTRATFAVIEDDHESLTFWVIPPEAKMPESGVEKYKRISEDSHQLIRADNFEKEVNGLCLKNGNRRRRNL